MVAHSAIASQDHLFYVSSNSPHRWRFVVLFDSYAFRSLPEVSTCHYLSILRHFLVTEQHMLGFGAHSLFG